MTWPTLQKSICSLSRQETQYNNGVSNVLEVVFPLSTVVQVGDIHSVSGDDFGRPYHDSHKRNPFAS